MRDGELIQRRKCQKCCKWFMNEEPSCESCKPSSSKEEWYTGQGTFADEILKRELPKHELTYKEKKK